MIFLEIEIIMNILLITVLKELISIEWKLKNNITLVVYMYNELDFV